MATKKRPPDYVRKIVNRATAPLGAMLRRFERLGFGDHPNAQKLRAKIEDVKARMKVKK